MADRRLWTTLSPKHVIQNWDTAHLTETASPPIPIRTLRSGRRFPVGALFNGAGVLARTLAEGAYRLRCR